PYAGWGAYGASKAALLHLSRIWDEELAPHGVRVEAIDPGDMDTPLHALAVPAADPAELRRPAGAQPRATGPRRGPRSPCPTPIRRSCAGRRTPPAISSHASWPGPSLRQPRPRGAGRDRPPRREAPPRRGA